MRLIEESVIEILEYPTVNWQSARVRGVTKCEFFMVIQPKLVESYILTQADRGVNCFFTNSVPRCTITAICIDPVLLNQEFAIA